MTTFEESEELNLIRNKIIQILFDEGDVDKASLQILFIMREYAKKHAIEFSKFKETYKVYESQKVKMQQDKLGGIFSWVGATDAVIYEAFLKGEQHANPLDERFLKEGK